MTDILAADAADQRHHFRPIYRPPQQPDWRNAGCGWHGNPETAILPPIIPPDTEKHPWTRFRLKLSVAIFRKINVTGCSQKVHSCVEAPQLEQM